MVKLSRVVVLAGSLGIGSLACQFWSYGTVREGVAAHEDDSSGTHDDDPHASESGSSDGPHSSDDSGFADDSGPADDSDLSDDFGSSDDSGSAGDFGTGSGTGDSADWDPEGSDSGVDTDDSGADSGDAGSEDTGSEESDSGADSADSDAGDGDDTGTDPPDTDESGDATDDTDESDSGSEDTDTDTDGTGTDDPFLLNEDFEAYTVGTPFAAQAGGPWTTWSYEPGSTIEDAVVGSIADVEGQVLVIKENNDVIARFGPLEEGTYQIDFLMQAGPGGVGHFNLLQRFWTEEDVDLGADPHSICRWGVEVQLWNDGTGGTQTGIVRADGFETAFTYAGSGWVLMRVVVDLDRDLATINVNRADVYEWQWSRGTTGTNAETSLAAIDFYGIVESGWQSLTYVDNISVRRLSNASERTHRGR